MKDPQQFVIVQERSTGNESVGNEWVETATFPPTATIAEVWEWANSVGAATGRTMIRPDMRAAIRRTGVDK